MRLPAGNRSKNRSDADRALAQRLAKRLRTGPAHERRIARIREAVASSDYENPLKLAIAVDRLLDRIPGEPRSS